MRENMYIQAASSWALVVFTGRRLASRPSRPSRPSANTACIRTAAATTTCYGTGAIPLRLGPRQHRHPSVPPQTSYHAITYHNIPYHIISPRCGRGGPSSQCSLVAVVAVCRSTVARPFEHGHAVFHNACVGTRRCCGTKRVRCTCPHTRHNVTNTREAKRLCDSS